MYNPADMAENAICIKAYAKINLHLEVLDRRKDGFHNIESIFHKISLHDFLYVKHSGIDGRCIVRSPGFKLPEDNTLTKAYSFFMMKTGLKYGAEIFLVKNIPSGAGLGGGSSDAASLLTALNSLFNCRLTKGVLKEIALNIGSDVPFFLENSPAAFVTGRGEKIKPLERRYNYFGVLIVPDIFSSTPKAYALLDAFYKDREKENSGCFLLSKRNEKTEVLDMPFFNTFEKPLFEAFPDIQKAKNALLDSGAEFALMSGSGAAVYGLYRLEEAALEACDKLSKQWKFCKFFVLLA